jgi:hypothetical protein
MTRRSDESLPVRPRDSQDRESIGAVLTRHWGGTRIVARGRVFATAPLPALIAAERDRLAAFRVDPAPVSAELVTLTALTPRQGVGTISMRCAFINAAASVSSQSMPG